MNDRHLPHGIVVNFVYAVVVAWAMTVSLPMRRLSGKHHLGAAPLGAMILMCYIVFVPAPHLVALLLLFGFAVALHLAGQLKMRLKGVIVHTRYDGYPWLARLIFFCKDEQRCKRGEPFIALLAGWYLLQNATECGVYFIVAGFAMIAVQADIDKEFQRRVDEMHNGRIENEALMETYHKEYQPQRRRLKR